VNESCHVCIFQASAQKLRVCHAHFESTCPSHTQRGHVSATLTFSLVYVNASCHVWTRDPWCRVTLSVCHIHCFTTICEWVMWSVMSCRSARGLPLIHMSDMTPDSYRWRSRPPYSVHTSYKVMIVESESMCMATIRRLLKIIGLFCTILSLL